MIIRDIWEWVGQNDPFDAFKCAVDFCYKVFGGTNMEYTDINTLNNTQPLDDDVHQFLSKCTNCGKFEIVARPVELKDSEPQVQFICLNYGDYVLKDR